MPMKCKFIWIKNIKFCKIHNTADPWCKINKLKDEIKKGNDAIRDLHNSRARLFAELVERDNILKEAREVLIDALAWAGSDYPDPQNKLPWEDEAKRVEQKIKEAFEIK